VLDICSTCSQHIFSVFDVGNEALAWLLCFNNNKILANPRTHMIMMVMLFCMKSVFESNV
jgi:hypothetical protein